MPAFKPPGDCPICGEFVPRGLVSCPACGSCAKSGWSDDAAYDGIDLPDAPEDFDYDDFVEREFGSGSGGRRRHGLPANFWWWVALALLAIIVITGLKTGRF